MISLVVNQDLITSLPLPDGWREVPVPDQGFALATIREFRPANAVNDNVSLCLFNRGLAIDLSDEDAAESFARLLTESPHDLAPTEIDACEAILGESADPERFSIAIAKTELLNGRIVLIVEGSWITSQTDMLRVYADIQGDGRFVQEISFTAPSAAFQLLRAEIVECFKAISWKTASQ